MKKIIIIPLGGLGTRFKSEGYDLPKPLINIFGKPIIYWLLDNLNLESIEYVYIPYNRELKKFMFEDRLIKDYPNIQFKFYCLDINTRGAAETLAISIQKLNEIEDKHVLCIDNDNFYTCDFIKEWDGNNMLLTFFDNGDNPIYSYIKCDEDNKIVDIKEKEKISNYACCGVYAFYSLKKLYDMCNYTIENNIKEKNEFYTSVVIKQMIKNGEKFYNQTINVNDYNCLGTPLQVKIFCKNNMSKYDIKKRYCFDLDGTLVSFPKKKGDYTTVEPIYRNIELLRTLKEQGNTIIIYTARRMKTHNSNVANVIKDIGRLTFDTLEKFNIPYDEIYFGKPYADFYIDDLGISVFDNLEKKIGYYIDDIKPRSFNSIEQMNMRTIIKKSCDLSGEIYYYNNIPQSIQKYFPIMYNHDKNCTWYQIEKIDGITISKLYLSKDLNFDDLNNLICIMCEIHNSSHSDINNINIYANYATKLKERYQNYDYSVYENSKNIYEYLMHNLEIYENDKKGEMKVIHGDPVFTNILLDSKKKLKFIDMRGKIDNKLTIFGDFMYDWSKIYQSLIGYDEILENIELDMDYKNNMINFFKSKFIEIYSEKYFSYLQLITKSLLFTLIPLHNNEKCLQYFNLITSRYLN